MVKKKIEIKYCGGCNPIYERVKMVERVQSLMEGRFLFLRHNREDLDVLVLMNGCPRACAGKNLNPPEVPYRSIIGESDLEGLMDWLTCLNEKGEIDETNCDKR
jgi:hypothetical protein